MSVLHTRRCGLRLAISLVLLAACSGGGGGGDAGTDGGNGIADAAGIDAVWSDAGSPDAQVPTSCSDCHGDQDSSAPPVDTQGRSDVNLPSVGAHRAHLKTGSLYFRPGQCEDCHEVPTDPADPAHIDNGPATLAWGPVATARGVTPAYVDGTCEVYCHGTALPGGVDTKPSWTSGVPAFCGGCHAAPPPPPHPVVTECGPCHPFNQWLPKFPERHADGILDAEACGACHAVPPATGAHAVHYGDTSSPPIATYGDLETVADYVPGGAPYYMFGCGNCHPLDGAKHFDGTVQVELYNPSAAAGSIKSKNAPTAAYANGTCSDVYCHSSGQAAPSFGTSPAWEGGSLPADRCSACHANPPAYPSGGAGSATANTHLVLSDDGFEYGHFGGLPGPYHGSYHGSATKGSSPITCQTCHYETVDATNTGSGGFYYLDTSGDYDLGGSLGYACATCHTGAAGKPGTQGGKVLPLRHVNGQRDIVFDPRQTLSASSGLPAAPNTPTKPYWVTAIPSLLPAGSVVNGSTWSFSLAGAAYNPAGKSCTNVPCHLKQSTAGSNPAYSPLVWGGPVGWSTCNACHQF